MFLKLNYSYISRLNGSNWKSCCRAYLAKEKGGGTRVSIVTPPWRAIHLSSQGIQCESEARWSEISCFFPTKKPLRGLFQRAFFKRKCSFLGWTFNWTYILFGISSAIPMLGVCQKQPDKIPKCRTQPRNQNKIEIMTQQGWGPQWLESIHFCPTGSIKHVLVLVLQFLACKLGLISNYYLLILD